LVGTLFGDFSVVDKNDDVCVFDGVEAMGD
jgi:hypothetical protein